MSDRFLPFAEKMRAAGLSESAVRAFEGNFLALERNETGLIPESDLVPVEALPSAAGLAIPPADVLTPLLRRTVVIKLNGGLGTGMGLERAKSLLPVRDGLCFLDLIAQQILYLRQSTGGGPVPRFLLMNSFSTATDSRALLDAYPELGAPEELEFLQNRVPKILTDSLTPLSWPEHPDLEWCPPGHGDLYASLAGSGWLDKLLAEGITYAFVSNSDNLGATLDPALLAWFAESGAPFLMEVTRRTAADKKGGHLALRPRDGRLVLRESAQCPDTDAAAFQDIARHRFFNTNNLWIRLDHLKETLTKHGGLIPLPMIRNLKTADPRDKTSPAVYQLETAMGAAIESFPGAAAIEVTRARFAPVKTTSDLLVIRSDACRLTPDFRLELHPDRKGVPPEVNLDNNHYKLVDGLDALLAEGVPSLLHCEKLTIEGPATFQPGVFIRGTVTFTNARTQPARIAPGNYDTGSYPL
jgi:UTP--glucose-1-phosphate uridylyltransferase